MSDLIRCKDCQYQRKAFHSDKRMKEGGYWSYGCAMIGDLCGYWAWGGEDNQFCSDAEPKGGDEV